MIHPALEQIVLDYEWTGDNNRWAKQYEVFLEDTNQPQSKWFKKPDKRKIGEKSWILVCSDEFRSNPNDEFSKEDLHKAYSQKIFDYKELERYLKQQINAIGDVSATGLFKHLDKFLILETEN